MTHNWDVSGTWVPALRRERLRSLRLLPPVGPAQPSTSRKPHLPRRARRAPGARGSQSGPSQLRKVNVGIGSAFGEFPDDLSRARAPPPPRAPPAPGRAAPLTVRQLHGASSAERASQAVELLHRSLHPRGALRAPPAAPAASVPGALHPAPTRPAGGGAGLPRPAPGTERTDCSGPRSPSGSRV